MSGRVLVIGGGISGLTTAHFLLRDGEGEDVDVRLVEAATRPGGTMGSEEDGGFVFERGPNGFLDGVPETVDLVRELGLEGDLLDVAPGARARYIFRGGQLHALPTGPVEFLRSPLLSLRGRLRVLLEPFQGVGPPGREDSVAEFGRRRLGKEATEVLLDALVTGIYAGDVERLSLRSAFPRIAEMERRHGGLFRALRASRKARRRAGPGEAAGPGHAAGPMGAGGQLRSLCGGLEQLTQALGERLGDRVALDSPAEALEPLKEGIEVTYRGGEKKGFDAVVVATPAPRASALFSSSQPDLCQALEAVSYAAVAVVCLGYAREDVAHPLAGYGFLIPRSEGLRTLGVIWTSSIFPAHAPPDTVSLRVLVGGARDPEAASATADELTEFVTRELGDILGIRGEPLVRRVYRYTQGIPQYNVGHAQRLQAIERQRWKLPGLFITGNAYRGVGVNDCVRESARVSQEVLRKLRD